MSSGAKASNARAIFLRAIEFPDVEARERFLDEGCGTETELRQKVEKLLAAYDQKQPNLLHAAVSEKTHPRHAEGVSEDLGEL